MVAYPSTYEAISIGNIAQIVQGLSTSGRGAGAREGDWRVKAVAAGDIHDDLVRWDQLDELAIQETSRTRRYLLQPNDVLLTARSTSVKAALVPPEISDTVAVGSLLVLRETGSGLADWFPVAQYLWLYLTSDQGREQVAALMTGATIRYLAPRHLAQLAIPLPPIEELWQLGQLVEASEDAYRLAVTAAEERRRLVRKVAIDHILMNARTRRHQ